MSGEVKISVERYEELREIERSAGDYTNRKISVLQEEINNITSGMVRVKGAFDWSNSVMECYITKDEAVIRLGNDINSLQEELNKVRSEIFFVDNAMFIDRLKYLFTGKLNYD